MGAIRLDLTDLEARDLTFSIQAEAMKHAVWVLASAVCAALLTGCVERRYVVYTDPPGATVFHNGDFIGVSPADDHYVYYGKHHFTIVKDGYETLQVDQEITTPWYEFFPLDFVSENINPWPIEDAREFRYALQPRRVVNTNELLRDAQNLRNRGQSIGAPPSSQPGPSPAANPTDAQGSAVPSP